MQQQTERKNPHALHSSATLPHDKVGTRTRTRTQAHKI